VHRMYLVAWLNNDLTGQEGKPVEDFLAADGSPGTGRAGSSSGSTILYKSHAE